MDWNLIESRLGVSLPRDYKEISEWYPGFMLDNFMRIATPREKSGENLFGWIESMLEILGDLIDSDATEGYEAFPALGGLLPWGDSDHGDIFYWKVGSENGESWTVVVGTDNSDWWEFRSGISDFLTGLIDGSIRETGLPEGFPANPPDVSVAP